MYLNKPRRIQNNSREYWLTLTLDVFKYYLSNLIYSNINRLTLTLDVFKLKINNPRTDSELGLTLTLDVFK